MMKDQTKQYYYQFSSDYDLIFGGWAKPVRSQGENLDKLQVLDIMELNQIADENFNIVISCDSLKRIMMVGKQFAVHQMSRQ